MKFARYLEDTQTPEWKKAYINYKLLKKRITDIRKDRLRFNAANDQPVIESPRPSTAQSIREDDSNNLSPTTTRHSFHSLNGAKSTSEHDTTPVLSTSRPSVSRTLSVSRRILRRNKTATTAAELRRLSSSYPIASALPLNQLYPQLDRKELAFFDLLNSELDKVESFYLKQEQAMRKRSFQLQQQLTELGNHKRAFHQAFDSSTGAGGWSAALSDSVKIKVPRLYKRHDNISDAPNLKGELSPISPPLSSKGKAPDFQPVPEHDSVSSNPELKGDHEQARRAAFESRRETLEDDADGEETLALRLKQHTFDPEDYVRAKKRLRKATLEHYRGLEMLQNYRILNVTGFRKALKKFEKNTGIPVQQSYMNEKINNGVLGSGDSVKAMISEAEQLFADKFEHGNKKQAIERLRAQSAQKTHHFSTFSTGIALGLAVPALVSGVWESYQHRTREAIPAWGALLYIYATLMVPTVFSLLLGVNILVWARYRINYVFIFELDVRSRLDPRQYFELPAILIATLTYAFWLSFSLIGHPHVSPAVWPCAWLLFALVTLLDPLPLLYKKTRYWTMKNVGRLLVSGTRRVEFTDFWLGDQFCSLTFSLSNLFFIACIYDHNFGPDWDAHCGVRGKGWGVSLALSVLPLFVRLVQCVRRYVDSRLYTHLINGGKYATGILSTSMFYLWRHRGQRHDAVFVLWLLINTSYSIYAGAWDYLMDWSILQRNVKYKGLRGELIYSDHILFYYLAIVSNIIIRFIWVVYIPTRGPNVLIRSFLVACLEALRRWQWNFYRVEAEFIGHMDQYRVTRDIPLPYSFDDGRDDFREMESEPPAGLWQRVVGVLGKLGGKGGA